LVAVTSLWDGARAQAEESRVLQNGNAQGGAQRSSAPTQRRILLLQAQQQARPNQAAANVERSLRQVLREMGFLVTASPMPFGDAQLATGCPGTIRECGVSVAGAVESERLAVAALEERPDARTLSLKLYMFAASGEARQGTTELPVSSPQLEAAVRQLARTVYGEATPGSEVVAGHNRSPGRRRDTSGQARPASGAQVGPGQPEVKAEPQVEAAPFRQRNPALWGAGWSTAAVGSALLVTGVATNLASRGASDDYARVDVRSTGDADEALASYERAERQADAARVLYGAGGALLLTGAALLVWGHLAADRDNALQVAAVPFAHGAALSFTGNFEGGSR
jgi:hypothetical protein